MRAITYRIAYITVLSVGIVLAAAFRDSAAQAAPAAAASAQPARTVAATVLPVVTLPAVHVRSAAPHAAAPRPAAAPLAALAQPVTPSPRGGASLPSLRLDMPYYSFGKLLPRVGKE